ncbi:putative bifunctional diguanylate cyclase/phosphodiesterase [Maritalea sp. S77]|uniref:putative bifunctional diguanylate cyclase/phosphodiesterase n=1 Tax=Maritalea sp. S77 TaxID=3415125 RepID=UPI003C7E72B3
MEANTEAGLSFSHRMEKAYKYGSLSFMAIGIAWAIVFIFMGWWLVVGMDLIIVALGGVIYFSMRKGHLRFGVFLAQVGLLLVAITMGVLLDVPTAEYPRVVHIYLLSLASLGYLNYQREKSNIQLLIIVICLLAFIVLSCAPLASPYVLQMPDLLRTVGTWANATMATIILAASVHAIHSELVRKDKDSRRLMSALWNKEFKLVFQPQVDKSRKIIGAEALIRWHHPDKGEISPASFIPQAEQLDLMPDIGKWVLEEGCTVLKSWEQNPKLQHLNLSLNVSAKQLMHDEFEENLKKILDRTGANPKKLTLEITESVLVTGFEIARTKLATLNELGITVALDDFGTGYSSLSYLRQLPVQHVKIDRSFVRDAALNDASKTLVKNLVQLCNDLGQNVVAEGVETEEQHKLLCEFGASRFQGFLYGRPADLSQLESGVLE